MRFLLYKVAKEAKLCVTGQDIHLLEKRVVEHEGNSWELISFPLIEVKVT